MSCDTKKLALDEIDKLNSNVFFVQGVLELLRVATISNNQVEFGALITVIDETQHKMEEVCKAVEVLTAA